MQCITSQLGHRTCLSRGSRPSRRAAFVPRASIYPGPKEEKDVSHEAFMHAFEASRPPTVRIPGLQEFAAAIWERRRRIPSTMYNDPLDHIFAEFDEDSDGSLSAGEITRALESRGVAATEEAVQAYIDAIDTNSNGRVERAEFANFIFHMASADLHKAAQHTA